jgi:hypothetical protein
MTGHDFDQGAKTSPLSGLIVPFLSQRRQIGIASD